MAASDILTSYIEEDTMDISTNAGRIKHIEHLNSLLLMLKKAQDILTEEKERMVRIRTDNTNKDLTRDGQWTGNYEEQAEDDRENLITQMKSVDGDVETLLLETEAAANKIRQEIESCQKAMMGVESSEG